MNLLTSPSQVRGIFKDRGKKCNFGSFQNVQQLHFSHVVDRLIVHTHLYTRVFLWDSVLKITNLFILDSVILKATMYIFT